MKKIEAERLFKVEILPTLKYTDKIAIRTAWHMYTDSLCKAGEITQRQYDTWNNPF